MGLLEDLNSGKYNLVLIGILFIFVFHQYTRTCSTTESMADVSNEIQEAIKKIYEADVEAIRNLSALAVKLNNKDGVTIPGNVTISGELTVGSKDIADGKITILNKDGSENSLIVKGMLVAWSGTQAEVPKGWALCDGTNGTPDLRGRFVLGAMVGDNKDDKHTKTAVQLPGSEFGKTGGEEIVKLTLENMPPHEHDIIGGGGIVGVHHRSFAGENGDDKAIRLKASDTSLPSVKAAEAGGKLTQIKGLFGLVGKRETIPHNNMPPYWVLAYIIKL